MKEKSAYREIVTLSCKRGYYASVMLLIKVPAYCAADSTLSKISFISVSSSITDYFSDDERVPTLSWLGTLGLLLYMWVSHYSLALLAIICNANRKMMPFRCSLKEKWPLYLTLACQNHFFVSKPFYGSTRPDKGGEKKMVFFIIFKKINCKMIMIPRSPSDLTDLHSWSDWRNGGSWWHRPNCK